MALEIVPRNQVLAKMRISAELFRSAFYLVFADGLNSCPNPADGVLAAGRGTTWTACGGTVHSWSVLVGDLRAHAPNDATFYNGAIPVHLKTETDFWVRSRQGQRA